jgi:hypothetical protein
MTGPGGAVSKPRFCDSETKLSGQAASKLRSSEAAQLGLASSPDRDQQQCVECDSKNCEYEGCNHQRAIGRRRDAKAQTQEQDLYNQQHNRRTHKSAIEFHRGKQGKREKEEHYSDSQKQQGLSLWAGHRFDCTDSARSAL